jgi:hypothetical protein
LGQTNLILLLILKILWRKEKGEAALRAVIKQSIIKKKKFDLHHILYKFLVLYKGIFEHYNQLKNNL